MASRDTDTHLQAASQTAPSPVAPASDGISVIVEDGVPNVASSGSYKETVRKIRETVSEKFGAAKRDVMVKLEHERLKENEKNNAALAKRYETDLRLLSECQLDELENVNVAIKCEIQTVQTRFGIKALSDLVARTNEELMRENLAKLKEMSREFERSHKEEMEHLHLMYKDQIRVLEEKLELCESETTQRIQELEQQHTEKLQQALSKYKHRVEELEFEEIEESKERTSHRDLISSSGDSGYWQSLASPLSRVVLEKDSQTDEQLQEQHETEIRRKLEEEYKRKMEGILADHSREIRSREDELQRINARFELDVSQLRETFESEKKELREKLEQSIPAHLEEVEIQLTDTLGTESAEYLKEYASRIEEMERNEAEVRELRDLLEERDAKIADLKAKIDQIKEEGSSRLANLEEEISRYHNEEFIKLKKHIEILTKELKEETNEREKERNRHEEIVLQLKSSTSQNAEGSLLKEIESYSEITTRLREAVTKLEEENKRLSVKLEERSEDFAAVNYELEKIQKEFDEEKNISEKLRAQLNGQKELPGRILELEEKLQEINSTYEGRISEISTELEEEREAGAQLAEMNQRLQMQTNINEKEIAKLTDQVNQLAESTQGLNEEIATLTKEVSDKETALVDHEALSERLQDELEELQGEKARKTVRREVREEVWEEIQEDVRQELEVELRSRYEVEFDKLRQQLFEAQTGEDEARNAVIDLEAQIAELEQTRQDDASDKDLLERQVNDQLKEISGLKSRLEEIKLKLDDRQIHPEDVERIAKLQRLSEQSEEEVGRKNREIEELRDQLAKLREKLAQQAEEFQILSRNDAAQKEQLEQEITSQDCFLREKETMIVALQTTINNLTLSMDRTAAEKANIKDSLSQNLKQLLEEKEVSEKSYQERVTVLELELKEKTDEMSRLQKELSIAQDGNKDLLQKFTQLEEKLGDLKNKLKKKDEDNALLLERINELEKSQITEQNKQKSHIESSVQTEEAADKKLSEKELETLKTAIKDLELRLTEEANRKKELEQLLAEMQQKYNEESARAARLEAELASLRKKVIALEAELQSRIEEISEVKSNVDRLEYEYKELQLDFENNKKLLESARNEMEEKKDECEKHLRLLDEANTEIEHLKQQLRATREEAVTVKETGAQSMKERDIAVNELRTTLEKEWQTKLTSLLHRHAQELKEAEEVNAERQRALQTEYRNKMTELEQRNASAENQRRDAVEENQADMEKLRRELEVKFREELDAEQRKLRAEIEDSYQVELKKARKEMKDENDDIWLEVDRRQKEEIDKIRQSSDKALSDKDKEMERLKDEYEICLQDLKAEHAKEVDRLTEKHKQEINDLLQKYKQQLEKYEADKLKAEEELKTLNSERTAWLIEREKLLADIKELKARLSKTSKEAKQSKESKQNHDEMRSQEREELLREIDELRSQIDSLQRDMLTENNRLAEQLQNLQDSSIQKELQLKLQIETLMDEQKYRRVDHDAVDYDPVKHDQEQAATVKSKPLEGPPITGGSERLLEQLSSLQQALDVEKDRAIKTAVALEDEREKNAGLKSELGGERLKTKRYAEQYEHAVTNSTKERAHILALLDKLRAELAGEKSAHTETVEELRLVRGELDKLRKQKSTLDQKHSTKFIDLQELLRKEITRNELLNCELEKLHRYSLELHILLEEERNNHDDTAREHRKALIQTSAHPDPLSNAKSLYPSSLAYTDLFSTVQYLKEENLDLWDELEFLRERGLYLETERDRLSYSLDATSKSCRVLEGRTSHLSTDHRILLTKLGACRTHLLSSLQRIQAIFSQFQKLQYSTISTISRDESWLSQIDALNRDLDDIRAELRRLDVHAVDDTYLTVQRRSNVKKQTDSDQLSGLRRPRSAGPPAQIPSSALQSSLSERHRQYLIFQKQYLMWLLSIHDDTERQTLKAVKSLEEAVAYTRLSHHIPYPSVTSSTAHRSLRRFRVFTWAVIAALRLRKSLRISTLRSSDTNNLSAVTFQGPQNITLAKLPKTARTSNRSPTGWTGSRGSSPVRQPGSPGSRRKARPNSALPWERVHSPPSKLQQPFRYA